MSEQARRNFCRKGTQMSQKTRKKQEKSKRNIFYRWTQINADVQKLKMFLSVSICVHL